MVRIGTFRRLLLASTAMAAIAFSPMAQGQTSSDDKSSLQLDEVIVTAQKRSENLQQTPVAVTAITADSLEQSGIQTSQGLMQMVPGLQVSTQTAGDGGGSATFFLRGMGQQQSRNGSEPAVGIYIDDIYYPSLEGSIFSILDIAQVEVLRGPQGTLFGRNTIGGAIRYTTVKPSDQFEGSVTTTFGSYGRKDGSAEINLPVNDKIDLRATVGRLETDGYVKQQDGGRDAGGSQTDLGRLQIKIKASDDVTVDISAQYNRQKIDGFAYSMPGPIIPGPLFPSWYNANPTHAGNLYGNQFASRCDYCQAGTGSTREFADTKTGSGTLVTSWDVADNLSVKSLTGWTRVDSRAFDDISGTPIPIFTRYLATTDTALSQEFQVNNKAFDNRLEWVGGLFYYYDYFYNSAKNYAQQVAPPPLPHIPLALVGLPVTLPIPPSTRALYSAAAYINGTFHLTDKLSLLGGFRYSDDDKRVTQTGFASAQGNFPSKTGRAGLEYQWDENLMSYATFSTGFRGGGFNPPSTKPVAPFIKFQPENDDSYEIGSRFDFFDKRLRLNPTLFYNQWSNIQVQSAVPVPGQGLVIELQNAGQAHTYGAEIEAQAKLTPELKLVGNVATLEARYDSIGTASGITVNSHLERAPQLTYGLGAVYTLDLEGGAIMARQSG